MHGYPPSPATHARHLAGRQLLDLLHAELVLLDRERGRLLLVLQLLRSGCGGAWRRVAGRGAQPCGRKGVWLAAFEGAGVAGTLILRSISSTEKTCSQWRAAQWRNAAQRCGGGVCREEAGCVARRRQHIPGSRARLQLGAEARDEVLLLLAQLICRADLVVDVPLLLQRRTARHERVKPKPRTHALPGLPQQSRHSQPRLSTARCGPAARGETRSWPC